MFSNYFHCSKNKSSFVLQLLTPILFSSLCAPLLAMDRDSDIPNEGTPLIAPVSVSMNEEAPIFFDGTRLFYDAQSRVEVRNAIIKKCLCATIINTIGCGCIGASIGISGSGFLYACGVNQGLLFHNIWGLLLEPCTFCGGSMCVFSTPVISITESCQASAENGDDPQKMIWEKPLEITPEMIHAADNRKLIRLEKGHLEALLEQASTKSFLDDFPWPWLNKLLCCSYCDENLVIESIKNRLIQDPDNTSISERELLFLLRDLTNYDERPAYPEVADAYAKQALLAKYGWLSFKKTDKYPLKCKMKYFDRQSIPEGAKEWYCHQEGQAVYLPNSKIQLIRHYKFSEDPAYQSTDTTEQ